MVNHIVAGNIGVARLPLAVRHANINAMLTLLPGSLAAEQVLNKKKILWSIFAVLIIIVGVIQFVPSPPLVIPAQLPTEQRAEHRLLNFQGIPNFRDLGGYQTSDGKQVKWGVLYRAGTLAHASDSDVHNLQQLHLSALIDFRSAAEKEEEPNRLPDPQGFNLVEIPTLDDGNKALVGEIMERIDSGTFDDFDPDYAMTQANRQFASEFTPQFRQFAHTVLDADGAPVLWHCSAGKDRTGFAAAVLLRILDVPPEVVLQDYMASREYALAARRSQLLLLRVFKGQEAADKLAIMMGVEESWLAAAFAKIDEQWGDFDNYVKLGLELNDTDIERLRQNLLQ